MARFVVGDDRSQSTLFPERLDEYLGEDNPVRAIDVFVDQLGLAKLGFDGVEPEATGRPAYHPATLLKIYRAPRKIALSSDVWECSASGVELAGVGYVADGLFRCGQAFVDTVVEGRST